MRLSSRLYAFLRGVARIIDPTIGREDVDAILHTSDRDALRSDWEAVGGDMWWAVRQFERDHITEIDRARLREHYQRLHNVNLDAPRIDSWGD